MKDQNKPLVSIIMPCYNHGEFVDEAVESVLAQTYENVEIVIVNDGSTDEFTKKLFADYKKPKTTVINTENHGLPAARNTAIKHAKGELILPLDADDKIAPDFLEKTVPVLLANPKVGVVATHTKVFGFESWEARPVFDFNYFLFENQITATSLFRRADWEKVGGYDEKMPVLEDYCFWLKLLNSGLTVEIVPELLFFYRKHKQVGEVRKYSLRAINRDTELFARLRIIELVPDLYKSNLPLIIKYIHHLKWSMVDMENSKSVGNYVRKGIKLIKGKLNG
jgi:glycosyltransferase involved in cell wall biosynthesis